MRRLLLLALITGCSAGGLPIADAPASGGAGGGGGFGGGGFGGAGGGGGQGDINGDGHPDVAVVDGTLSILYHR